MLIDLKTLVVLNCALGMVSAIMLTINWRMNPSVKGTKEWSMTLWCWAFSMFFLLFRGVWPPIITIVFSNGLVVLGSFFMLSGLSKYHNRVKLSLWLELVISSIIILGFYYYSFVEVDIKKRVLLLTSFSAVVKFAALYLLVPTIRRFTGVGIIMAIGFFLHGLFFAYHSFLGAFGPIENASVQLQQTTIQLLIEVFLFMLWFTVATTMLTNVVLQRGLKRLAYRDSLTGILNRRSVLEKSQEFLENNTNSNFSILVLDLDHFKKINDTYGHAFGDKVLQNFVSIVSRELRNSDIFGRIGGEEFLISLPDTNLNLAQRIAKRIIKSVNNNHLTFSDEKIKYTVSIGIESVLEGRNKSLNSLISNADESMYLAKQKGRNRFYVFENNNNLK